MASHGVSSRARGRVHGRAVDVVIPYCDDAERLTSILLALDTQIDAVDGRPLDGVDIIVADDASTIRPDASGCASDVRVVRQEMSGYHPASARNLGAADGSGDVVVFLDADTVPAPTYIATLVEPILARCADLTTGRRRHADLGGLAPREVADFVRDPQVERLLPDPQWLADGLGRSEHLRAGTAQVYQYVISAVMAVRRTTFVDVGGFDERFDSYGGEDWEFAYRCWNAGWDLLHVPDAHAFHDGPDVEGRGEKPWAKTVESLRIVDLVPASATRLAGVCYSVADLDVTLRLRAGDLRANATSVASILASTPGDLVLSLIGSDGDVTTLRSLVADQRLIDAPRPDLAARCDVEVDTPIEFAPRSLAGICADVADGTLGERLVHVGSARVRVRSRRHARKRERGEERSSILSVTDGSIQGLSAVGEERFADWARRRQRTPNQTSSALVQEKNG